MEENIGSSFIFERINEKKKVCQNEFENPAYSN